MRDPIVTRLMLGGAFVALVAFGAVAMRAALPEPPTPVSATTPQASTSSRPAFEPEYSDPVMTPDSWVVTREIPAATETETPAPVTTKTRDESACEGDYMATCPDETPTIASRPMVASESEGLGARTTTSRTSRLERRVSSGPMRMLGGGESTW